MISPRPPKFFYQHPPLRKTLARLRNKFHAPKNSGSSMLIARRVKIYPFTILLATQDGRATTWDAGRQIQIAKQTWLNTER